MNMPGRESLLAGLRDPSSHVRCRAALELGTLRDPTLEDALLDAFVAERDPFVRDTLTRALAGCSETIVPRLITLLAHGDAGVRQHAAHVLGKRADAGAADALMHAVADPDPLVAYKAVFALGRIRDRRSIEVLVPALGHPDRQVRRAALDAIQSFGPDAVAALIAALDPADNPEHRRQIAYALGASGGEAAVTAIRGLLADADDTVRLSALQALNTADPTAGAAAAAAMRNDPDARVRALAARFDRR
jgi:HEAT repeat protein